MISQSDLTQRLKTAVLDLGFQKVGIAPVIPGSTPGNRLRAWLDRGFAGTMQWIERRSEERADMTTYFPEAQSVIVVALNYYTGQAEERMAAAREGIKISNYAWGQDYHGLMKSKLKQLQAWYQEWTGGGASRVCVDTSPVMEKVWAQKAGLGWMGKHTNLITRDLGSWIFLGEFIVDQTLDYDVPFPADHCGTCTACIDACPTQALTAYVLDARKCISYLTIEYRGPFSQDIPGDFDGWVYGCDICQEVCPWNQTLASPTEDPTFQPLPEIESWSLDRWNSMDAEEFRRLFRTSPIKRTRFEGFRRNLDWVTSFWE